MKGIGGGRRRAFGATIAIALCVTGLCGRAASAEAAGVQHGVHQYLSSLSKESAYVDACGDAVDSHGNVYVADAGSGLVHVYEGVGTELASFAAGSEPCGLAIEPDGDVLVAHFGKVGVTEYHPSSFPPASGTTYSLETALNGSGTLDPGPVRGVAVNPADGSVYVSHPAANEVQAFTLSGFVAGDKFAFGNLPSSCTASTTTDIEFTTASATRTGIKNALLAACGAGSFNVSKSFWITFEGAFAATDWPALSCAVTSGSGSCTLTEEEEGHASYISRHEPDGTPVGGRIGTGLAGAEYTGLDVYEANGRIYAFDAGHAQLVAFDPAAGLSTPTLTVDGSETPAGSIGVGGFGQGVAVDQESGRVYVFDPEHKLVDEFNSKGEYISGLEPPSSAPFSSSEPSDVAVDNSEGPDAGYVYVTSVTGLAVFGPLAAEEQAVSLSIDKSGPGAAFGTVESDPAGVVCGLVCAAAFEPGTEVILTATTEPGATLNHWSGCDEVVEQKCHVTLAADRYVGAAFDEQPAVSDPSATAITATSATLSARVNPNGQATTYHFEYGDQGSCDANPCLSKPVPDKSAGSTFEPVTVSQPIAGLTPGTTYHFRVVATNASGTAASTDATFTVYEAEASLEPCPANEAFRTAAGARLPDCRAYEQASPVDKNGNNVYGQKDMVAASPSGDAVTFLNLGGLPGAAGSQSFSFFLARRGDGDWSAQGLYPPASLGRIAHIDGWTPDLSQVFVDALESAIGYRYFVRSSADAFLSPVRSLTEQQAKVTYVGGTPDGSVAYFNVGRNENVPGSVRNLYAWDRATDTLSLVGVLPDVACDSAPCPAAGGSSAPGPYWAVQQTISSDGRRAYFEDEGTGQLYMRENATSPDARTVHVSASEKTNGGGPGGADAGGPLPATFRAANGDGSSALFTSSEELTNDARTNSSAPTISRYDASDGETDTAFAPADAAAIAVDAGHLYWIDETTGTIGRANLGASQAGEIKPEFIKASDTNNPKGLAVGSGYIYWTNAGDEKPEGGTIGRAKLGAEKAEEIEPNFITGANNPRGITATSQYLYWTNFVTGVDTSHNGIGRASTTTGSAEQLYIAQDTNSCGGYAADVAANESHLFVVRGSNSLGCSISLDTGSSQFVPTLRGNSVAATSSHVYFTKENQVIRISSDGTGETVLFEGSGLQGIAADSSHAYWGLHPSSAARGEDLYRYDGDSDGGHLTDLTPDHRSADVSGAEVAGVLGASDDLSYVYFVANGVLATNAGALGTQATPGNCGHDVGLAGSVTSCNLYVNHDGTTSFITRLSSPWGKEAEADHMNWLAVGPSSGETLFGKTSRVSADGKVLLFRSHRQLTTYDNHGSNCPSEGCTEIYRYEADSGETTCVSCNPTGEAPAGSASLNSIKPGPSGLNVLATVLARNMSADGNRIFFESPDKLIATDTNGEQGCPNAFVGALNRPSCQDVYEWEADGTGSCHSSSQNGGCLYLISTGTGDEPSFFGNASASGNDVFFFTYSRLVPQDRDGIMDVYDARVGGGLAAQHPPSVAGCSGDACRGSSTASPNDVSPGSASFSGPGNQTEGGKHKKKQQRKGRRHKRKQRKAHVRHRRCKAHVRKCGTRGRRGRKAKARSMNATRRMGR